MDTEQSFDHIEFIIRYEDGYLEHSEIVNGFQKLIDSGLVWKLQGSYGRMAERFIEDGLCTQKE
ncbi:hypothetical protein LCGC14_0145990 [marine sediment metagenome]|uniref:DUF7417 domain-containing protein n=1 Tax=marine sediment metagenome TaxID=412755 RepID=A0A0F9Y1D6_9ZZZZ